MFDGDQHLFGGMAQELIIGNTHLWSPAIVLLRCAISFLILHQSGDARMVKESCRWGVFFMVISRDPPPQCPPTPKIRPYYGINHHCHFIPDFKGMV